MNLHRRSLRLVALAVVVALPLLGTSGVASAKAKTKAGCHKTHSCKSGGGVGSGGGSGTGSAPAPITVQIDPNPLVETGQSYVVATIQVETSPAFAGDSVNISSSQLTASCDWNVDYFNLQDGGSPFFPNNPPTANIQAVLDDDGNATVLVVGYGCAPGSSVVEADLMTAPYYTGLATLTASPPVVTATGVSGYPTTSGTVTTGEVETGDSAASGDSDVIAIFYVETSPVYAEQQAEISSNQLQDRCGGGSNWFLVTPTGIAAPPGNQTTLDDDGNAVFVFLGDSCAAGTSEVTADVEAGDHPTYTTSFNIVAPQPTI
jgi:hypothetical protein